MLSVDITGDAFNPLNGEFDGYTFPSGDGMVGSADLDIIRANWGTAAAAAVDAVMDEIAPTARPEPRWASRTLCTAQLPREKRRSFRSVNRCFDRTVGFWPRPGMPGCESEMRGVCGEIRPSVGESIANFRAKFVPGWS